MNILRSIKKPIRTIGAKLGLLKDWDSFFSTLAESGQERESDYYDTLYQASSGYGNDYTQSEYYFLWSVVHDRIAQSESEKILEVGCGSGQFAALLKEQGISEYVGFDFSNVAIEMAQARVPDFIFFVADAFDTDLFSASNYDIIVCTEVLEHVEEDRLLLSRIAEGTRCLCTVPNFPFSSHVRFFENATEVEQRYGDLFTDFTVSTLRGIRNPEERFYLFDGVKS